MINLNYYICNLFKRKKENLKDTEKERIKILPLYYKLKNK